MRARLVLAAVVAVTVASLGCSYRTPLRTGMTPQRAGAATVGGIATSVIPPLGIFWSGVDAPLAQPALDAPIGTKKGTAVGYGIALPPLPFPGFYSGYPLIGWGDASQQAAARQGGISDATHADYHLNVLLMFFRRFEVRVYGN